jgi:hypothetical protein
VKVRVVLDLDIDPDAWMLEYGVERAEVRKDVQEYVANGTRDHLSSLGVLIPELADS